MKTYPIMLNVTGRCCVVVGAGRVGRRKARDLRLAGAKVRVVDPDPPDGLADEGVELVAAAYEKRLLTGAMLVFACTDDPALNARIAADARLAGALVNVADQPADCDFFLPAVAGDGEVILAVGTGGASPAVAVTLRDRLARHLPQRIGEFAAAMHDLRQHLRRQEHDPARRRQIMKDVAGESGYKAFVKGGADALIKLADELAQAM